MISKYRVETSVGLFVFIALLCVAYLAVQLGQMHLVGGDYYTIKARFSNVAGLREGNDVMIAGVKVGRVNSIALNQEEQVAMVGLEIRKDIQITDDSIASIKTSGLIGDKYVSISIGGSPLYLEAGDMIVDTQPPVDFEELVSKYVFGNVDKD